MAQWFINDLSLAGQYETSDAFWSDLEILLFARNNFSAARNDLFCSRGFSDLLVSGAVTVREAVYARNSDERFLALRWLTKGPLWETHRHPFICSVFYYLDRDVTEQGLGEAARRKLSAVDARTISFPGGVEFHRSPIVVQHLSGDEASGEVGLTNTWDIAGLRNGSFWGERKLARWEAVIEQAESRCDHLIIPREEILGQLLPYPYDDGVAERVIQLLAVLQCVAVARKKHGDGSKALTDLMRVYFVGKEALFSDESAGNKKRFRNEMTFVDPLDAGSRIFAPWHGKIRTPLPYRIHFEWPIPKRQTLLKVLYIGPKITRS